MHLLVCYRNVKIISARFYPSRFLPTVTGYGSHLNPGRVAVDNVKDLKTGFGIVNILPFINDIWYPVLFSRELPALQRWLVFEQIHWRREQYVFFFFFWNVCQFLPDHKALHPRRIYCLWVNLAKTSNHNLMQLSIYLCSFSSTCFGLTRPSSGAMDVIISLHIQHMKVHK